MRILLIEDDAETARLMKASLSAAGHEIDHADKGKAGLIRASSGQFDALVVDRMLPEIDGLAIVSALRKIGIDTPVLFLTALGGVADRVAGLDCGGDDYITKPFYPEELNARVNALGRRSSARSKEASIINVGDLIMNRHARTVTRGNQQILLQPLEFKLLEQLVSNLGQIITRSMLIRDVWGLDFDPGTNIVENHISKLRAKIDVEEQPSLISTIRGAGYVIYAP